MTITLASLSCSATPAAVAAKRLSTKLKWPLPPKGDWSHAQGIRNVSPIESDRPAEETKMALWDEPRGSRAPRADASTLCMTITIGGLVAAAVAIKWLIALL
jgi:hypothetical protein